MQQQVVFLTAAQSTWAIPQEAGCRLMHCEVNSLPDYFEPWIAGYAALDDQTVPVIKLDAQSQLQGSKTAALLVDTQPAFMIACDSVSRPQRLLGTTAAANDISPTATIPSLLHGAVTSAGTLPALNLERTCRMLAGANA